jgi:hypothetical protein
MMSEYTGCTRQLTPGGQVVFQVIPPGMEQPIPARYYETFTAETRTDPNGTIVRLNSMGDVGQPPRMNFLFTQEEDGSIYLHGMEMPDGMIAWITRPESGRVLNYPGLYTLGLTWVQDFVMGPMPPVYLTQKVEAVEEVAVPLGTYRAFRIVSSRRDGTLDSLSWFAPDLGVNIKKISHDPMRPGYALCETHFTD